MSDIFSIVPLAVIQDHRLTLVQTRVLIALLSFRSKNSDTVWPKRDQLAARCGYPLTRISEATSDLVKLGWLVKSGNGGRSTASDYMITVPETITDSVITKRSKTVTDSVTVTEPVKVTDSVTDTTTETVTDSVTKTVTDSVTKTVTDSVTGIQQTIEQTIEQTNKPVPLTLVSPIESGSDSKPKKASALTPEMRAACQKTWEAYSNAYQDRYGVAAVKNAKSAGQIVQFVKRIGMVDAEFVAGFYPSHSARWYVQVGHSVDAMLKDAEKLRMEWATNRKVTSASANSADKLQAASAVMNGYIGKLEERYASAK